MLIKWGVIHENVDNSPLVYMPTRRACAPSYNKVVPDIPF